MPPRRWRKSWRGVVPLGCAALLLVASGCATAPPASEPAVPELAQASAEEPLLLGEPVAPSELGIDLQELRTAPTAGSIPFEDAESGGGKLVPLPPLHATQQRQLLRGLEARLGTEHGYAPVGPRLGSTLPPSPQGVGQRLQLGRSSEGRLYLLQLGALADDAQPLQLWLQGSVQDGSGQELANPDVEALADAVPALLASLPQPRPAESLSDLESQVLRLSYADPESALAALGALGITTFGGPAEIPQTISGLRLPIVTRLLPPSDAQAGLVGGEARPGMGIFGVTVLPNAAAPLSSQTVGTSTAELLVLFDPARPEQVGRVKQHLETTIDRAARQVLVEGMVLEVSQSDLRELGIEYFQQDGSASGSAGGLFPDGTPTLLFTYDNALNLAEQIVVNLRVLVEEGKAEILSRPSILTLDDRQATIRVGDDIPIATSSSVGSIDGSFSFSFNYLPTGILLNIRPRISEDDKEVTMIIDATVSAEVQGESLQVRDTEGQLLAEAPTISTRRVQTYARIQNNTPLIIGGLITRTKRTLRSKVPILGDLPWVGYLFGASEDEAEKREVIIVLTPYVLVEGQPIARTLPQDDDLFDSVGNQLFRDVRRLRAEDVFDLSFLDQNQRLQLYRERAQAAIRADFRLAETPPFSRFAGGRTPGENILVERMIYELLRRIGLEESVREDRILFFDSDPQQGVVQLQLLDRVLERAEEAWGALARDPDGRALAITFYRDRELLRRGHLATEPRPEVTLVEAPDRGAWSDLLWELNQPLPDGRRRSTILLQSEEDLVDLKRAILLKLVLQLNGGDDHATLRRFGVGRLLLIPRIPPDEYHLLDADVARYFFHVQSYYRAAVQEIEQTLAELEERL